MRGFKRTALLSLSALLTTFLFSCGGGGSNTTSGTGSSGVRLSGSVSTTSVSSKPKSRTVSPTFAGGKIYAVNSSGSIGVIMGFVDLRDLMKKVGVEANVVKSGEFKDIGANSRPFTAADRKVLQGVIDDVYAQFVSAVAKGRGLGEEKVRTLADGRIYSGHQAKELGLVDRLGGFDDAVEFTAKLAGIKGKPFLVKEKPRFGFIKELLGEKLANNFDWFANEATIHKPGIYYLWRLN
ncbi:MAG: S49 family peptidase [Nitrospinae bacterium]|nr:S49 family peptidase [Nitrospinota bacterium]